MVVFGFTAGDGDGDGSCKIFLGLGDFLKNWRKICRIKDRDVLAFHKKTELVYI